MFKKFILAFILIISLSLMLASCDIINSFTGDNSDTDNESGSDSDNGGEKDNSENKNDSSADISNSVEEHIITADFIAAYEGEVFLNQYEALVGLPVSFEPGAYSNTENGFAFSLLGLERLAYTEDGVLKKIPDSPADEK